MHRVFQGVYETVAVREAEAARAGARAGGDLRGRPHRRLVPARRPTSRRSGRTEPYSEGIIDYLRAVEGAELAALDPRAAAHRAARCAAVSPALDRRRARRLGDRPRVRRRRASSGGRLLERGVGGRDHRVRPARVRTRHPGAWRPPVARLDPRGSSSWTSRRARRPSRSSRECARARRAHRPRGHARSVRHPACCSCCPVRQRGSPRHSSDSTSATSRTST